MSEQEMLVLSTKDRDRLKVLHEVRQGHLTQREAGEQLGFTDRWVRKLLGRVKKEGDRGVVHRLRGRVSNRRLGGESPWPGAQAGVEHVGSGSAEGRARNEAQA